MPFIDVREPQPDLTELVSITDEEPFILHPGEFVLGQTLEWVELPDDLVARLEGKSSLGPAGAAHPLHRGLCRPRLEGHPDAGAVERREPAHRAVLRHEDRPDQLLRDVQPGRATVRQQGAGLQVPGPVDADGIGLLPGLRRRAVGCRRAVPDSPHGDHDFEDRRPGGVATPEGRTRRWTSRPACSYSCSCSWGAVPGPLASRTRRAAHRRPRSLRPRRADQRRFAERRTAPQCGSRITGGWSGVPAAAGHDPGAHPGQLQAVWIHRSVSPRAW